MPGWHHDHPYRPLEWPGNPWAKGGEAAAPANDLQSTDRGLLALGLAHPDRAEGALSRRVPGAVLADARLTWPTSCSYIPSA